MTKSSRPWSSTRTVYLTLPGSFTIRKVPSDEPTQGKKGVRIQTEKGLVYVYPPHWWPSFSEARSELKRRCIEKKSRLLEELKEIDSMIAHVNHLKETP